MRIFGYYYKLGNDSQGIDTEEYVEYNKPKICYEDSNILVVVKDIDTLVHSDGNRDTKDLSKDVRMYLSKKKILI